MTAISSTYATLTEVSSTDIPITKHNGTVKRRKEIFVRVTPLYSTDTLDLSTYVSGLSDIEGIKYITIANADSSGQVTAQGGASATWSSTTLTFGSVADQNTNAWEMCVIGTY